jgi:hypothetical protein
MVEQVSLQGDVNDESAIKFRAVKYHVIRVCSKCTDLVFLVTNSNTLFIYFIYLHKNIRAAASVRVQDTIFFQRGHGLPSPSTVARKTQFSSPTPSEGWC